MRRVVSAVQIALLVLAVALAGCGEVDPVRRTLGHATWLTPTGTALPDATYDFGPTLVGTRAQITLFLDNQGLGAFRVESVTAEAGFSDTLRYPVEAFSVGRAQSQQLTFSFTPNAPGRISGRLVFHLIDADDETIALELRGTGVDGGCTVEPSEQLDFGAVAEGGSYASRVTISNPSGFDWKVTLEAIETVNEVVAFKYANFVAGEYTVPARGQLLVPVEFTPNHVGEHSAYLKIAAPAMCQRAIKLVGIGLKDVLECEPRITVDGREVCGLEYGYVNPGGTMTAQFTLTNRGNTDVTVKDFNLQQPPGKSSYTASFNEAPQVIAARGGSLSIPVTFAPNTLGDQRGAVRFVVDAASPIPAKVELVGKGGGPNVEVIPGALDYGIVGVGSFKVRRITIANTGTDDPATTEDNLKLTPPPAISPADSGFVLEALPSELGAVGLKAGASVDLRVRFAPTSTGARGAKLLVHSNDPDQPVTEIELTGRGENMPPCEYELSPPRVAFGMVEPGRSKTLNATFVNKSANPRDTCTIYNVELATGSNSNYSLPAGNFQDRVVAGGERVDIPVRFGTGNSGSTDGALLVYTSSVTAPVGRVMLSGTAQTSCLMLSPSELNFGTVRLNCTTNEKRVTVTNNCSTPLTVNALDLHAGASAGYRITHKPALPYTIQPGYGFDVRINFRPLKAGDESGTLSIRTGLPDVSVVSLIGKGSTTPIQTDVFGQQSRAKIDTLLVVDNSGSMYDEQTALGTNFRAFIKYAVAQQVDYHIAVTTTAVGNGTRDENGRFVPLDGSRPRVITPSTPNAENVFMQNVAVGTSGNATEQLIRPAYLALTNPLLTGHNAGFLREDAALSIVIVSDAADQDNTQLSFYENWILSLKGEQARNMVSVSGIIATMQNEPAGCGYDESSSGQSTRVRTLVTKTGGVFSEICGQDWAKMLSDFGDRVWGLKTAFYLSNPVDATQPVTVLIDGVEYPEYGPLGDRRWWLDYSSGMLNFEPLAVPEPGSTLSVTYQVACTVN